MRPPAIASAVLPQAGREPARDVAGIVGRVRGQRDASSSIRLRTGTSANGSTTSSTPAAAPRNRRPDTRSPLRYRSPAGS